MPAELTQGPKVVKAWATWCSSCQAIGPLVEGAATASGVPVVDLRVDVDPDDLVKTFKIRSVPTLIGLRDGIEVGRLTGAQPRDAIDTLFAATGTGTGSVISRTSPAMTLGRGAAGLALVVAGLVLATMALVAVGVALLAWAVAGLIPRRG